MSGDCRWVEKQFNSEILQCRMTHGRVVGCLENHEMLKTIEGLQIRLPTTGLAGRVLRVTPAPASEGFCVGDCLTWPIEEWNR